MESQKLADMLARMHALRQDNAQAQAQAEQSFAGTAGGWEGQEGSHGAGGNAGQRATAHEAATASVQAAGQATGAAGPMYHQAPPWQHQGQPQPQELPRSQQPRQQEDLIDLTADDLGPAVSAYGATQEHLAVSSSSWHRGQQPPAPTAQQHAQQLLQPDYGQAQQFEGQPAGEGSSAGQPSASELLLQRLMAPHSFLENEVPPQQRQSQRDAAAPELAETDQGGRLRRYLDALRAAVEQRQQLQPSAQQEEQQQQQMQQQYMQQMLQQAYQEQQQQQQGIDSWSQEEIEMLRHAQRSWQEEQDVAQHGQRQQQQHWEHARAPPQVPGWFERMQRERSKAAGLLEQLQQQQQGPWAEQQPQQQQQQQQHYQQEHDQQQQPQDGQVAAASELAPVSQLRRIPASFGPGSGAGRFNLPATKLYLPTGLGQRQQQQQEGGYRPHHATVTTGAASVQVVQGRLVGSGSGYPAYYNMPMPGDARQQQQRQQHGWQQANGDAQAVYSGANDVEVGRADTGLRTSLGYACIAIPLRLPQHIKRVPWSTCAQSGWLRYALGPWHPMQLCLDCEVCLEPWTGN